MMMMMTTMMMLFAKWELKVRLWCMLNIPHWFLYISPIKWTYHVSLKKSFQTCYVLIRIDFQILINILIIINFQILMSVRALHVYWQQHARISSTDMHVCVLQGGVDLHATRVSHCFSSCIVTTLSLSSHRVVTVLRRQGLK